MKNRRKAWGLAFLGQARCDLAGAGAVGTTEPHTLCVMLQMGFEKLGKAFRCRFEEDFDHRRLQRSHRSAYTMTATLAAGPRIGKMQVPSTLSAGAQQHLALIRQLEGLQPANAKKNVRTSGQLEYPWPDATGKVKYPAKHLQFLKDVCDPFGGTYRPDSALKFASEVARQLGNWLDELQ